MDIGEEETGVFGKKSRLRREVKVGLSVEGGEAAFTRQKGEDQLPAAFAFVSKGMDVSHSQNTSGGD